VTENYIRVKKDMRIAKAVGKELKMIMMQKEIKQVEVAEKFGSSKNSFNNLINQNLNRISDILEISDILDVNVKLTFTDDASGRSWDCVLSDLM
jgi:predicted XRE-type DNA-binding protein